MNAPQLSENSHKYSVEASPPDPLTRKLIDEVLPLGVKAVDGLITVGKGQRIGIFAGSGVGKSTLMGMFARNTKADVNVIALIGERGRDASSLKRRSVALGRYFFAKAAPAEPLRTATITLSLLKSARLLKLPAFSLFAIMSMAE